MDKSQRQEVGFGHVVTQEDDNHAGVSHSKAQTKILNQQHSESMTKGQNIDLTHELMHSQGAKALKMKQHGNARNMGQDLRRFEGGNNAGTF